MVAMAEGKREDILRCAQALILGGGYNGFSYADISKVVGIRNASIHHHFPSKVSLVRELVVQYRERVRAGLGELDRRVADPLERLKVYAGYWEACIADGSLPICVCALLATEIPVLPEEIVVEIRGHFQDLSAWLNSVLEQGVRSERIRLRAAVEAEAQVLMASVHGALLSVRASGDAKLFGVVLGPVLERLAG